MGTVTAASLLWTLTLAIGTAAPQRATIPPDVSRDGLVELTRQGEVVFLPQHDVQPFNAVILSSTPAACGDVEKSIMDVEGWPKLYKNIKKVTILEKAEERVRYVLELDIKLAPDIPGLVENPQPGRVVFTDPDTKATFIYTLEPNDKGCTVQYSLLEAKGKPGGWTAVVRALEESAVDAANVAAAVSSLRGYAKGEQQAGTVTARGTGAMASLAHHGTVMRVQRVGGRTPVVIVRRVVARPIDEVLWSLRDRVRYSEKIDFFSEVAQEEGGAHEYDIRAFGGRVSFDAKQTETGDAATVVTIEEKVTGGDLKRGSWVWKVRPVPGGTDVELVWDVDVIAGSSVLAAGASFDPMARECMALHFALAMMGDLVGGRPIAQRPLAAAP
jgi:hypothetical protein